MNVKKSNDNVFQIIESPTNSNVSISQQNGKADTKTVKNERETWTGKFDFFLTALGYAVGLGAIWSAFLIPYFVFLFLVGIPLVFLEMSLGQFTSSGPMTCFVMSPIFRGIGFSVNTVNNYVNVYFTMILTYSIYFFFMSLNTVLPWQNCNPNWKQKNCVDNFAPDVFNFTKCLDNTTSIKCDDGICYNIRTKYGTQASCELNQTYLDKIGYWKPAYPSQIFWKEIILEKSESIEDSGHIVWQLLLGLFIAWLIILATVIKGIKVSGKLVYFTALFPYVVLLILGIRGWMLDGAAEGIKYYIYPDFSKLNNLQVWSDAATQIFFTLSVSYGGLIALASYNDFNTNILRDAITVSLANCGTSIFAGFVVFSYIGYLSKITGLEIEDVVQAGQGLAFVVYPFAVTTIKGAPFWSCMFFLMMLILGLDSTMGSIETFITSIFDEFPKLRNTPWLRYSTIIIICASFFLLGIVFTLQSGTYWLELFDTFAGNWAIFIVAALESVSVGWFYGFDNFRNDIAAMIGPNIAHHFMFNIFRVLWCFITPVIVMGLFVIAAINLKGIDKFPPWTLGLGNFISATTLFGIIIWALYMLIDALFINKRPLVTLIRPASTWRPRKDENLILVQEMHREYPVKNKFNKNNQMIYSNDQMANLNSAFEAF